MAKAPPKQAPGRKPVTPPTPEQAEARGRVREDSLAHLRGLPNHDEIVEATRLAQEEAVARRDAGQSLVEQGYAIVGAEEDENGFAFLVKPADDVVQRAPVARETVAR